MNVGFNTNISYGGRLYHVQTEDSGLRNPVVVTLLYCEGSIIARKDTNYSVLIEKPDSQFRVKELMKLQHRKMIQELMAGRHASANEACGEEAAAAETEKAAESPGCGELPDEDRSGRIENSLDDVLLDFIIKRHKKE
jgi:hypothetical protein